MTAPTKTAPKSTPARKATATKTTPSPKATPKQATKATTKAAKPTIGTRPVKFVLAKLTKNNYVLTPIDGQGVICSMYLHFDVWNQDTEPEVGTEYTIDVPTIL